MSQEAYDDIYQVLSKHFSEGCRYDAKIIVFSAVPGSGKSELTKRLSSKYGYFRIANKDIRESFAKANQTDNVDIADYTQWLLGKLNTHKKRSIVFDRNIDQLFDIIKVWSVRNNYRIIVVTINCSRKILEDRLLRREGDRNAKAFSTLDFYVEQHVIMQKKIKPDITLEDDYDLDHAAGMIADF